MDFFAFLELYFRLSVLLLPLCYSRTACLMFTLTLTSQVQWSLVTTLCRQWTILSFSIEGSSQDSKIAISKRVSYCKEKWELSFRDNCTILKTKKHLFINIYLFRINDSSHYWRRMVEPDKGWRNRQLICTLIKELVFERHVYKNEG